MEKQEYSEKLREVRGTLYQLILLCEELRKEGLRDAPDEGLLPQGVIDDLKRIRKRLDEMTPAYKGKLWDQGI